MKSKLRTVLYLLEITLALLIVLELITGVIIRSREHSRFEDRIALYLESGAYPESDHAAIESMFNELYENVDMAWEPYVHYRIKPTGGEHINVLQDKTRLTTNPPEDAHISLNVFVFGGSTIWGTGARDAHTIPSELAALFAQNPNMGNVRVSNYGNWGFVRTQENVLLMHELQRGNIPDLVIFYDGVNDLVSSFMAQEAGLPQNTQHRTEEFNIRLSASRQFHMLLNSSYLYRAATGLGRKLGGGAPTQPANLDSLAQSSIDAYKHGLDVADALGQLYGFQVLNFWQPHVFGKQPRTDYEEGYREKEQHFEALFNAAYNIVPHDPDLTGRSNVFDLGHTFDGREESIFIDFVHKSEAGNALVAAEMNKEIVRALDVSP